MATRHSTSVQFPPPELAVLPSATFQTRPFEDQVELVEEKTSDTQNSNPLSSIQPKLTVGAPGDAYEQEADRIADQVMAMGDDAPQVQQQSMQDEEDALQRKPLSTYISTIQRQSEEEDEELQAKGAEGKPSAETSAAFDEQLHHSSGGGAPLPNETRAFFEPRIGFDFSQVRVHTDSTAVQMSQAINAQAFTHGSDIYFGSGRYDPGSDSGKRLLAHELTHVVQQSGAASAPIQRVVETLGGDWDTDRYDRVPESSGQLGVDIDLKFTPKDPVDATQIALTQSIRSQKRGSTYLIADQRSRADHVIPEDEAGGGTLIDRLSGHRNPLYGTDHPTGDDLGSSTELSTAEFGWHYTDANGTQQTHDAHLRDEPKLNPAPDAEQVFETTALAVAGTQQDTYYGSVQWGWRTDSDGNFTQLPLEIVSAGVPSPVFMRAAQLWNQGQTSLGDETIDLPLSDYHPGRTMPNDMTTTELIIRIAQLDSELARLGPGVNRTNLDFEKQAMQLELSHRDVPLPETENQEAQQHFAAGQAHFAAGRYGEALARFEQSYALLDGGQRAELAYDMGLCHQRLGQAAAISFYQEYLSQSGLSDRNRALALEQIRRVRLGITETATEPPAPTPEAAATADTEAQAIFQQGREAADAGNYTLALERFNQIYGNPDLEAHVRRDMAFNMGVSHQQLGNFGEAISFYEEYTQFSGVSDDDRLDVLDRIRRCRQGGGAAGGPALSEEEQRQVFANGQTAFTEGRYADALALFEQVYQTPLAEARVRRDMVFNMGIAHQRLQAFDAAIEMFQEYLLFPGLSDPQRQEALNHIHQARQRQTAGNVYLEDESDPVLFGDERVLLSGAIFFETGQAEPSAEGRSTVGAIANLLQEQRASHAQATFRVTVVGQASAQWTHPGGSTPADLNRQLSETRATCAAELLSGALPAADVQAGVYTIATHPMGSALPLQVGEPADSNAWRYRSVQFVVWMRGG